MTNAFRFAFVFLESFFKRLTNDGFASDKAIIILGCTEVAAAFSVFNLLVANGAKMPKLEFGFGIALLLGILVVVFTHWIIKRDSGLEAYRKDYKRIPKSKRILGGMVVIALAICSIIAVIVTSKMVSVARLASQ